MATEADRDLAAKLKARLARAALRGEKSVAELSAQFDRIDQWTRELERDSEGNLVVPDAFTRDGPSLNLPARKPPAPPGVRPPPAPTPGRRNASTLPTLPLFGPQSVVPAPALARERVATLSPQSAERRGAPQEAGPDNALDDDFWREDVPSAPRPQAPQRAPVRPWSRRLLGPLFVGWQERHHAARTSRELLKLYEHVASTHPSLPKQGRYRLIVMARLGVTLATADAVLARAAESFATWPVERELTYCDVVHYLAISDYFASVNEAGERTRANFGRVVSSLVPENL